MSIGKQNVRSNLTTFFIDFGETCRSSLTIIVLMFLFNFFIGMIVPSYGNFLVDEANFDSLSGLLNVVTLLVGGIGFMLKMHSSLRRKG